MSDILSAVEALIARSEALEPTLHAWAAFEPGVLRRQARQLDAGARRGPLHGVAVAVKDNIDTAGQATAYGSPIYAGHVPVVDAACVALLRGAGALIAGKAACTEFANFAPSATRNPWHAAHTPGGSSSGSAAAVAAGLVPLALGTQTAGSVIRPAAFCGIVGVKPSPRRVPRAGVKPNSDTLDEVGVMARTVAEAARALGVLAGSEAMLALAPAKARFALALTSRADAMSPAMVAMVEDAASRLGAAGASVLQAAWPEAFDGLFDAQRVVQVYETARALAPEWQYRRRQLSRGLRTLLAEGQGIEPARYDAALQTGTRCVKSIDQLFGAADVLVTAAAPGAAPASLETTGDPLFNRPWQLLGCPCVTLPGGLSADGLPLGLQLVARPGEDEQLLAAAAWAEDVLDARIISHARGA